MKMNFKRITALALVMLLTASLLSSCGGRKPETPSKEEIFEALSQASREAMDLYYAEYVLDSVCGYFFDENCTIEILHEATNETAEPPTYTATVEAKRSWKNVEVTETEEVHFAYDVESEAWELVDYVILELDPTWHIDGEYHSDTGVTIGAEVGEYVSGGSDTDYFEYEFMFANNSKAVFTLTTASGVTYTHGLVKLRIPCSKGICASAASFDTDGTKGVFLGGVEFVPDETKPIEPVSAMVTIYPDEITYVDYRATIQKKEIIS